MIEYFVINLMCYDVCFDNVIEVLFISKDSQKHLPSWFERCIFRFGDVLKVEGSSNWFKICEFIKYEYEYRIKFVILSNIVVQYL